MTVKTTGSAQEVTFIRPASRWTPEPDPRTESFDSVNVPSSRAAQRSLKLRSRSTASPGRVAAVRRSVVVLTDVSVAMRDVRETNLPNTNGPVPAPTLQPSASTAGAIRMRQSGRRHEVTFMGWTELQRGSQSRQILPTSTGGTGRYVPWQRPG